MAKQVRTIAGIEVAVKSVVKSAHWQTGEAMVTVEGRCTSDLVAYSFQTFASRPGEVLVHKFQGGAESYWVKPEEVG